MKKHRLCGPHRQVGLSLIELLVAMVVALFVTLIIAQTFALAEGYRRTGTAGGDANFAGAVGAYLLNTDLASAGYGINSSSVYGCTVNGSDQTPPSGQAPRTFSFALVPVQIQAGANAQTPDSITIVYSSSSAVPGPLVLASPMASATDNYTVNSAFGVKSGDLMILVGGGSGANCYLTQATNTPTSASSNQNVILHASSKSARYNPSGGLGGAFGAGAPLLDVGPMPVVNRYYVQAGTLMLDQPIGGTFAQTVGNGIVQLKAFYGVDTVGDGAVHQWANTAPASWSSVLAMRFAVAAQSANPEKTNPATGTCTITTALPSVTWEDGTSTTLDVSQTGSTANLSWQCFRYKVFHANVSLRNLIWKTS
jgi:type IV pilus assembly protein PilW